MGFFRATVIHTGQIVKSLNQSCGKCLQDGHRTYECLNDWVCKNCKQSGHKSGDCTATLQDSHESQEPAHHDQPPWPQQSHGTEPQVGASETGRTPVSAIPLINKRKKKKVKLNQSKQIRNLFKASSNKHINNLSINRNRNPQ